MDRFAEESAADLMLNYKRRVYGFQAIADEDPCCDNCDQPCNHRIYNSDFHARVCPKCNDLMKEAVHQETLETLCAKRHEIVMAEESVHAIAELLKAHDVECAICGSGKKIVMTDRLLLDKPGATCCGEAA